MVESITAQAKRQSLTERIKAYRISYPMTQKELAEKTGISLRSISRFESGEDITATNLIKILTALNLDKNLEILVPDILMRPSAFLESERPRKRASSKHGAKETNGLWKWGDEA